MMRSAEPVMPKYRQMTPIRQADGSEDRVIPSFFILDWSVVLFIPSRVAAPLGPLMVQPVV